MSSTPEVLEHLPGLPGACTESPPLCRRTSRGAGVTTRFNSSPLWAAVRLGLALLALSLPGAALAKELGSCHVGAYRLADGQIVEVGPSDGGLRWRALDGRTGKLTPDGAGWRHTIGWTDSAGPQVRLGDCGDGEISIGGTTGKRVALEVRDTQFKSQGVALQGRLVLPAGRDPVAIVVLLHGAEFHSALDFDALQRLLPGAGVGAVVYDKRGTGRSGGKYTQDFKVLAEDAVAALAEARRLAGPRVARIGFLGPSQGGWIAPLAAEQASVDFVVVSFGLAVSVAQEDQEAIAFQMRLKGHDAGTIAKAQEIGKAATTLFASGFTKGFEAFDAVRAQYRDEPWYKDVHGNYTHVFLPLSADEIRAAAPRYQWGTPVHYDPMPVLNRLETPQLWVLGGQDLDAPSGETARRLSRLIETGRPITYAIYPGAEHGLTEFEVNAAGERISTHFARGYFRMLRDFARHGRICPPYGDARIEGVAAAKCATSAPGAIAKPG